MERRHAILMILAALFCLLFFAGCGEIKVPQKVGTKLEDNSHRFVPGKTGRDTVRSVLGEPIISSRHWRIDVFRQSISQTSVGFFYFIPICYTTDTSYRYTLVTYDSNDIVSEIDTGIDSSIWMEKEFPQQKLTLETENFIFLSSYRVLLYKPSQWNYYIYQTNNSLNCSIFVGCRSIHRCSDTLQIDKEKPVQIFYKAIAQFSAPPGRHTIKISDGRYSGEESISFSCENGEKFHFVAGYEDEKESISRVFLLGLTFAYYKKIGTANFVVEKKEQFPDYLVNTPILLWYDGRWLIEYDHKN